MITLLRTLLGLAVLAAFVGPAARGGDPAGYDRYPIWIVRLSTDATDDRREVVDGAMTDDEASEKLEKWKRSSKLSDPFFYQTAKNPRFDGERRIPPPAYEPVPRPRPSAPDGTPFVKLPRVDPGPLKPGATGAEAAKRPAPARPLAGAWTTTSGETIRFDGESRFTIESPYALPKYRVRAGRYSFDGETVSLLTTDDVEETFVWQFVGKLTDKKVISGEAWYTKGTRGGMSFTKR